MTDRPLAIDLFCGLGGWAEGLLAEGYDVVGFDIEQHEYGNHRYPGLLVIQDALTLHGSQFRNAALIVASPPCQAYSYRAMPWKRAKALPPPNNTLFHACFRIQREACAAAGHHIPLVVENVRGAQKWVGRARWNFGSFYLWGDVPALMPSISGRAILKPQAYKRQHETGSWFAIDMKSARAGITDPAKIEGTKFTLKKQGDRASPRDPVASAHGRERKFASAMIAKIPLPLSRHIAATFFPKKRATA